MNKAKCGLLLAMGIFGTVGIFVRYIPLPAATVAFFRGVLGLLFLLGVMAATGKKPNLGQIRQNLWVLLLSGGAMGLNWVLLFESYNHTTVAIATICYYLAPVFLILVSPLLGERLTGRKCLLSAVALLGMVFVSGVLEGGLTGGKGITLAVGAAFLYTTVMFLNKKLGPIDAYDKSIVQLASAAAVILPYSLLTGGLGIGQMASADYGLLAVVGIIHTGVAYWLYFGALGRLSSQTVALFSYLDPVIAILLSALWLGEPLGWQGILGAVLILGSTLAGELPAEKMGGIFAKKG
ncbi:MAG: DMT family transporter [Oscillospiraceae bacterium]|nr:DMT family transporter [Oscillospiraceae bacterium]